eukprot:TRINITY_DN38_c1_g1_i1.p1 TRINITY_DN38_c1_g1~~TRINITY_DN38_c1_g1_i1.p1  ORF type:complete len:436 (-),score=29.92 TRINITY_DN38_c1_g1_i1:435-1742(-)
MAKMIVCGLAVQDLAAGAQARKSLRSSFNRSSSAMSAARSLRFGIVASTAERDSGLKVREVKDCVVIARGTAPLASLSTETAVGNPAPASAPGKGGIDPAVPLYLGTALAVFGIFTALKFRSKPPVSPSPPAPAPAAEQQSRLLKPRLPVSEAAKKKLASDFPITVVDNEFVSGVGSALASLGFTKQNSIALVDTCRDEIARPLVSLIEELYGHSFTTTGLGGLITCGKVGLTAGIGHSPAAKDPRTGRAKEKYVLFAFPHVGIDEKGTEGKVVREGRSGISTACGALAAVRSEILAGTTPPTGPLPDDDIEYGLLKGKLFSRIAENGGAKPSLSLIDLTKVTEQVIREDLEDLISKVVDPAKADYAVITGVQIHTGCTAHTGWTPDHVVDYIAPCTMYAVVNGRKYALKTDGHVFYSEPLTESNAAYARVSSST